MLEISKAHDLFLEEHFLSKCSFLPVKDLQFLAKARAISDIHGIEDPTDCTEMEDKPHLISSSRIQVI